jgi:hypothetical protein
MDPRRDPLRSQPFTPTTIQDASRLSSSHQSPATSRILRKVNVIPEDQHSPFPPHPSVRMTPKSKPSPRGMPMGVGVAPRPTRNAPAAYSQNKRGPGILPPSAANNAGPVAPSEAVQYPLRNPSQNSLTMHSPPPVHSNPNSSRRYNMTQSYVSSIYGDTPQMSYPDRESHYPEDDSPRAAYPSSKIMPQAEFSTPSNRRGTMNTVDSYTPGVPRLKPRLISTSARPSIGPKPGEISPASTRANAMNALSQAIAVGISKPVSPVTSSFPSPKSPPSPKMRMPFDGDDTLSLHTADLEPPELKNAPPVPRSRLQPAESISPPKSPKSATSEAPMLGLGIAAPMRGLSTKRGLSKRPPQLDINAVRDMEARGSTTSLTDLIKRATKLASNLDRGKTASRLGMLDMFGKSNGSHERLGALAPGKRDS